ncbi:MAG: DegQ family serine endoprotease [Gammaproteobacteria bacterium]
MKTFLDPRSWLMALVIVTATAARAMAAELPDFDQLVEQQGKAVVYIKTTQKAVAGASAPSIPERFALPEPFRKYFEQFPRPDMPRVPRGNGIGSGFIISPDGFILTNAHVVRNADEIIVGLDDRRQWKAELVGEDRHSDVAVIKVDAENLPTVKIGDSDELKVGQWVLAIGAPFGFDYTATQGIVSALARNLPSETYVPFIQTDVALNPGNSGGPLFDLDGYVVGINSQIYSRSGGYQGLSFAIPINIAMNVADQLKTTGHVSRGWLGVTIQGLSRELAGSFGLDTPKGALVAEVSADSPAARAGIKPGDIIIEFNGRQVAESGDLPALVGATPAGKSVDLTVLRNGKERTLQVEIAELEQSPAKVAQAPGRTGKLGVMVAELDEAQRDQLGTDHGVAIREVQPNSPAAKAGLRANDVLLSFNREKVDDAKELSELVARAPSDEPIAVLVLRDNIQQFLALTIPEDVS